MAKKREQEKPQLGGLQPVRVDNLPYKEKLTKDIVAKEIRIIMRDTPDNVIDHIKVFAKVITKHEDGSIINIREYKDKNGNPAPMYITKDKGAFVEYDLYEETKFRQDDIDNPDYIKVGDPVSRIYYVDGQVEEEDPDNPEQMIMVDNEVDIEPEYRKGTKNPATRTVITEADEPLAAWEANAGAPIRYATLVKLLTLEGYNPNDYLTPPQ